MKTAFCAPIDRSEVVLCREHATLIIHFSTFRGAVIWSVYRRWVDAASWHAVRVPEGLGQALGSGSLAICRFEGRSAQNRAVNPTRIAREKPGEMFVLLSALT